MELRHLRYFVAVAEEEHITRAASRLGIQQPPLSQQISALEQEIGVQLFTREARSIRLNAAGKMFLSDARRILAAVNDAVTRVRHFDLGQEGSIRIGFTSSASMHEMTLDIVRSFHGDHPLVSLEVQEGANHDLLHMVEQERLDIAFIRSSADRYPMLETTCLLHEEMVLAVSTSHALAKSPGKAVPFEALRDEDLIIYRQVNGSGIGAMLLEACGKAGFEPHIVDETPRIISALQLVAAGFGIAVVPKSLEAFQSDAVVYRPFKRGTAFTVPLNVAYRRNIDAETLRRFIVNCLATAQAANPAGFQPGEIAAKAAGVSLGNEGRSARKRRSYPG